MNTQVIKYKINATGEVVRALFEDETQYHRWSTWKYAGNYSYYDTFEEARKVLLKRTDYEIEKYTEELEALTQKLKALDKKVLSIKRLKENDCKDNPYGHMAAKPSHEFRD